MKGLIQCLNMLSCCRLNITNVTLSDFTGGDKLSMSQSVKKEEAKLRQMVRLLLNISNSLCEGNMFRSVEGVHGIRP